MATPDDSSELPSFYGQTTLSGLVARPPIGGDPQLTQPTRPPRHVRPASMHWPPNSATSHGSSLPTTPTQRSNRKGTTASMSAHEGRSEVLGSPKLPKNQDTTQKPGATTDYFGKILSGPTLDENRTAFTSGPVDPRTGREYALPPAARNTNMSTPCEKDDGENVSTTTSTKPVHNYSRSMSFYDAMKLKRAEAEAQTKTQARRVSSVSFCDTPVLIDGNNNDSNHSPRPLAPKTFEQDGISLRLSWTMWMNSTAKNHFVATMGELVGTVMFLFFAFAGTQVATGRAKAAKGNNPTSNAPTELTPIVLLYISLSFSFSLMVNVWIFFRISGGLFNPAVSLTSLGPSFHKCSMKRAC